MYYTKSSQSTTTYLPTFMSHTLKIFPTYKAGVNIDVGERDRAELLKVEVQHTPGG